jgi:hypothetical protein
MIDVNDLIKRRAMPALFRPRRSFLRGLWAVAAPAGVSPRMARLIAEYRRCAEALAATDYTTDAAWDAAGDLECRAFEAPLDQRPTNMAEFTARFVAVILATGNDNEFHVLRVLAADARELAEAAR